MEQRFCTRGKAKKAWTASEDAKLLSLIDEHGPMNWSSISSLLTNRTGKQCRERYHNHLQPSLKKGDWSEQEDTILAQKHAELGNQWSKIASFLPGRSDNAVKNRWHTAHRVVEVVSPLSSRVVPSLDLRVIEAIPIEDTYFDHALHSHEITLSSRSDSPSVPDCLSVVVEPMSVDVTADSPGADDSDEDNDDAFTDSDTVDRSVPSSTASASLLYTLDFNSRGSSSSSSSSSGCGGEGSSSSSSRDRIHRGSYQLRVEVLDSLQTSPMSADGSSFFGGDDDMDEGNEYVDGVCDRDEDVDFEFALLSEVRCGSGVDSASAQSSSGLPLLSADGLTNFRWLSPSKFLLDQHNAAYEQRQKQKQKLPFCMSMEKLALSPRFSEDPLWSGKAEMKRRKCE